MVAVFLLLSVIEFIILSFKLCVYFRKEPELFLCSSKEPVGVETLFIYSYLAARNYGTTKAESEERLKAFSPEILAPPLLIGGLPPVAFGFRLGATRVGLFMPDGVISC